MEVAFARFKLIEGKGSSSVYSHRVYGESAGDEMSTWLKANGRATETALMEWTAFPSPKALSLDVL